MKYKISKNNIIILRLQTLSQSKKFINMFKYTCKNQNYHNSALKENLHRVLILNS